MEDQFPIGETLAALEAGSVIVYPTDTVWGLGCDATNAEAVSRVLRIKSRSHEQGLISIVGSVAALHKHVDHLHPRLQTLLAHHTRPLTIVYADAVGLARGVTAADGSAAIRVTRDPYCRRLAEAFGRPIVSTSANLRGEKPPRSFGAISSEVLMSVDHVVKYRQREVSTQEPSVIARWTEHNEIEPIRT